MRQIQLHLITILVLSFTAAGVLWLNVHGSQRYGYIIDYDLVPMPDPVIGSFQLPGWPCGFLRPNISTNSSSLPIHTLDSPSVLPMPLILDLAVGLSIMLVVAILCESVLRRRKRQRQLR